MFVDGISNRTVLYKRKCETKMDKPPDSVKLRFTAIPLGHSVIYETATVRGDGDRESEKSAYVSSILFRNCVNSATDRRPSLLWSKRLTKCKARSSG